MSLQDRVKSLSDMNVCLCCLLASTGTPEHPDKTCQRLNHPGLLKFKCKLENCLRRSLYCKEHYSANKEDGLIRQKRLAEQHVSICFLSAADQVSGQLQCINEALPLPVDIDEAPTVLIASQADLVERLLLCKTKDELMLLVKGHVRSLGLRAF